MRLEQSQSLQQKQIISPEMIQGLELLTLPILTLTEKLENEAVENPVIELEYPDQNTPSEPKSDGEDKSSMTKEEVGDLFQDSSDSKYESPLTKKKKSSSSDFDKQSILENLSGEENAFADRIEEELQLLKLDEIQSETYHFILASLDSDGFLRDELFGDEENDHPLTNALKSIVIEQVRILSPALSELPENEESKVLFLLQCAKLFGETGKEYRILSEGNAFVKEYVEMMRKKLMRISPIGAGSKNHAEFLTLQAELEFGKKSLEYRILSQGLELLEKKIYSKLATKFNTNFKAIEKAVENIQSFRIAPATSFSDTPVEYVVPDAKVLIEDGEIKLILNDEYIPKVKLNQYYVQIYDDSKGKKDQKETKDYLKGNIDRAKILIENLSSRKETIFKVIYAIVEKQRDFFLKGKQFQVPLKLKDIADELGIHESTVSRAISGKYIQTNRGIVSLKNFFSTQIGNSDTSANSIKEIVKRTIDAEDKDSPLSDDKIVGILANRGIEISRRTVAKYRDELNIPRASVRRNPH